MRALIPALALCLSSSSCRTECHSVNAGQVPATPEDPPLTCPVVLPPDTHAPERAACTFGPGALAEQTLGISADLAATWS
ncbi:MAG: hypothetical protein ACOZQL_28980 [Myxococcota bacterium]